MKLILLLSFLKLSLAINTTDNITSSIIEQQLKTQHPTGRIFISPENPRRKPNVSNATVVPGTSIDAALTYRHVNSREPRPSKKAHRKLRIPCTSSKCVSEKIKILFPSRIKKIRAELKPTDYIGLRDENKLAGPEGKIAEALANSINTSLVVNGVQPFELILNLMPISDYGAWSLVYHPYRKVPLVPVIQRGNSTVEMQVTFCLLTMLTIMIIMLLHVMRNLIRINDLKSNDAFEFLRCIVVPKSFMSGVETFFYLCLACTFFVNLGIILEIIFLEKYGKNSYEKIQNIEDLEKLNLTPVFSTEQCLRELVINKSKKFYCIVDEDLGKEVIRRYGNDGRDRTIRLIDSVQFKFEWRGMYLDEDRYHDTRRYLERFNHVQMKLLQSGLLDKWYKDEMILNLGKDEMEMKRVRAGWSGRRRDENERLKKFIYFLVLMISNGALMAFFTFMAECLMQCNDGDREMNYLWN